MSFRELVETDNHEIFMNLDELAEEGSIRYDGPLYESIPVVLTGAEELDCPAEALGDCTPEQGRTVEIHENGTFFHRYRVERSVCEMGMLEMELEAIDE